MTPNATTPRVHRILRIEEHDAPAERGIAPLSREPVLVHGPDIFAPILARGGGPYHGIIVGPPPNEHPANEHPVTPAEVRAEARRARVRARNLSAKTKGALR